MPFGRASIFLREGENVQDEHQDILYRAAEVWKELTEYHYVFTYGYKGELHEIKLTFSPSLKKIEALPKGKAPIKRFLSIHRIYSACGYRSTHGLAPQSADTEPVHCFIATDSWSMPLSSSFIIPQKDVSSSA